MKIYEHLFTESPYNETYDVCINVPQEERHHTPPAHRYHGEMGSTMNPRKFPMLLHSVCSVAVISYLQIMRHPMLSHMAHSGMVGSVYMLTAIGSGNRRVDVAK